MAAMLARLSAGSIALGASAVVTLGALAAQSTQMSYPKARKADIVDTLHGTRVPDPYRWLENAGDPETVAWVEAQNALTRSFVGGPERDALVKRLTELFDYPRTDVPVKRGSRYFFTHNTGLQPQAVLYVQDGLSGARRVLLDPNTLSPDGTVALTAMSPSDDGALLGYALSRSGSDRQEIHVREVDTGRDRPDRVLWAKFTGIAWLKDGSAFYYTRFPEPGRVPAGDENYYGAVYLHRLGEDQARDRLVFERRDDREIVPSASVSDDGRWLVVTAFKGSSEKSEVFVAPAGSADAPAPLFTGFSASWNFIDAAGDRLFFQTDDQAPLGRVVAVDAARAAAGPRPAEVVAQAADKLNTATIAGGRLVLSYLHSAAGRLRVTNLDGSHGADVTTPIGTIYGVSGRPSDAELFYAFTSFTAPPSVQRYDVGTGAVTPFAPAVSKLDPGAYETKQVWYPSKDGTKVSMFLVHRKDIPLDGSRPALLYGYGGFNINMTPGFDPSNIAWLDRGGVYALANLRGGGEYGERWHQAGMFEKKQNVFDDFIAAAEWLIANKYTSRPRLAIEGGSNGGLLVGAAMVQRPDLFGAVICRVPVADMLRYHLFTVGRFWISEYGSADDPKQFPYLLAYSPYHNVKDGVAYPATLVTTADTDDRVAPGMAKKFAARLQAATAGPAPILIRVDTKAGHGAGKPVTKMIEEDADIFSFLFKVLPEGSPPGVR
ncbi:MAG: S9 family peptidase [Acidobacteria bacterium]|nr:S9 family peptidase [Acidobacteriota bacterium]